MTDYNLTTLSEVKVQLELTSDTTYDTWLSTLISAASVFIENYCKRKFVSREYTEYYDGKGRDRIFLNHRPISAIAYIYDDCDREFGADTLIDSDEYTYYAEEGIVRLFGETRQFFTRGIFQEGVLNVKIKYTAGETVPADLNQACVDMVIWKFRLKNTDGISSESIGSYSVSYSREQIPSKILSVLDMYANCEL